MTLLVRANDDFVRFQWLTMSNSGGSVLNEEDGGTRTMQRRIDDVASFNWLF